MNNIKVTMRTMITVLCLTVLCGTAFATGPDTTDAQGILTDDPILAALDSLSAARFFNQTDSIEVVLNEVDTGKDSIPEYDKQHYIDAFAELDRKTPFHLVYNHAVKAYIDAYTNKNKVKVSRIMGLAEYYFPLFEEMLDRYNLPLEFKYLAIVESALNPTARSRSGASGLWQFMYRTGRIYDLRSTSYIDQRQDPYRSTQAACEYFKFLYDMFGDWELVLAAYNGGPGNLLKAMRRAGGKSDYWEVRPFLRQETQGYVPAFMAVNYVMNHAADYHIYPEKPDFMSYEVDTVVVHRYTDLRTLAATLHIPYAQIAFLNPMYRRSVIPQTKDGLALVLPKEKVGIFLTNQETIYDLGKENLNTAYTKQADIMKEVRKTHKVRYGETLGGIAARYRCKVSDLRKWNGIRGNLIRVGQHLTVYSHVANTRQSSTTSVAPSASDKGKYHVVVHGDTLWDIARQNGITVDRLKELNRIGNHHQLKIGTRLKIG